MTRGRTEAGQIHCSSKLGEASILRGRYIECIVERILSSRRIFRVAGQDQVEPGLVTVKLDTWQRSLAELAVGGGVRTWVSAEHDVHDDNLTPRPSQ